MLKRCKKPVSHLPAHPMKERSVAATVPHITVGQDLMHLFYSRGPVLTLPSAPNPSRGTCPRTGTPSSTGSGTLWSPHPSSTPSWP